MFLKCGNDFVAGFAKNDHESLYRRILTKYKSSKLFERILEDNKQDKRENPGKKIARIAEPAMSATQYSLILFKRDEFLPA